MHSLLFLVTSNPRTSHRPAEAIRIAVGVGVWNNVSIALYLREAAVLALSEDAAGLIEEETYTRYLPGVRDLGRPIYAQRGAPFLADLGETPFTFEEIDDSQLARLAAHSHCVLRF